MATTTVKSFFTPNPSSYSDDDYSDSEIDDFEMVESLPASTVSMHPRPSASKATLYRKRQPGSNAKADTVLVNGSLPTRMINNPGISLPSYYIDQDVLDFKETQVFSQGLPVSSTPHTFEEEESSFTSSTASRHTLFQTVYEKWQNDDEARLDVVPEIDGRHTSASSRTSSSIYEQYQQDLSRISLNPGINIGSQNFHSETAELARSEVMAAPLPTRVRYQGRERLHEQGRTTCEVVEEEDEEYSNDKYNITDNLHDNYHRENSNSDIYSSAASAPVHPFYQQQPPPLTAMPFPVHSNFSMNNTTLTTPPRHANPSPFLDDAKRSQILEWKKHAYNTSPPSSPVRTISRTPIAARAVPDYTAPASTGSDELFGSPLSSYGPQRAREMSYDSTSTVHAGLPMLLERRRSQADGLLARGANRPILRDEERFPYRVAPEGDKVSGESESDVNDDEFAAQTEAVASKDNAALHTIRDPSVSLESGDDDSARGERIVAFRIKDGNVKQAAVS
ncbi:hypothetical protein BC937DRAFT_86200 [Endogone sp. FLAS-F59071]|nr:hypothetical protein BC937DRAFT_86200 [Endogone sp. FLAS-F59071]|eukprot:RUS13181.1 hypothetical protein BC937DRAFT_86200 [Endogone sp. FLAS-F59071]